MASPSWNALCVKVDTCPPASPRKFAQTPWQNSYACEIAGIRGSFCDRLLNAELSYEGDIFANHTDGFQERLPAAEGTCLGQFFNVDIARKLSASETDEFFHARAATGKRDAFLAVLDSAGEEEPCEGDTPLSS
jgi:hypothetical protein